MANKAGRFQSANKGTLFLDEIGEMPLHAAGEDPARPARARRHQGGRHIARDRWISASSRRPTATSRSRSRNGRFREDLYYRLNVVHLLLPPLRDRGDDIVVLARYMLSRYAPEYSSKVRGFTPSAIMAIKRYRWPGNIRELENRIKKAVVLADKTMLGPEDLGIGPDEIPAILPLADARERWQRSYIIEVLGLTAATGPRPRATSASIRGRYSDTSKRRKAAKVPIPRRPWTSRDGTRAGPFVRAFDLAAGARWMRRARGSGLDGSGTQQTTDHQLCQPSPRLGLGLRLKWQRRFGSGGRPLGPQHRGQPLCALDRRLSALRRGQFACGAATHPTGGQQVERAPIRFSPNCSEDALSRDFSNHRLLLAVSDRPFDDTNPQALDAVSSGNYLVEGAWSFELACP